MINGSLIADTLILKNVSLIVSGFDFCSDAAVFLQIDGIITQYQETGANADRRKYTVQGFKTPDHSQALLLIRNVT